MIIDCDSCIVREIACHDCVVSVILSPHPENRIDEEEKAAIALLSSRGLVPPLRFGDNSQISTRAQ